MRGFALQVIAIALCLVAGPASAEPAAPTDADVDGGDADVESDGDVEAAVRPRPAKRAERSLAGTKVIIATKPTPPFAIKNADGSWTGLSIELWRRIAEELELETEIRETDHAGMLAALEEGSVDAGVAAITVTAAREEAFDFTHPFYSTGLGIAVNAEQSSSLWATVTSLFSWEFTRAMGGLLLVLFLVGLVMWGLERRKNPDQFGGGPAKGIGAGFWWSAVTMTTVGYGDKAPITFGGRALGLVWMFVSIVTISGFTAAIASALTVSSLGTAVEDADDLPSVRVGTIAGTTSAAYMAREHITFRPYETILEGLEAVAEGEIDAMVYDAPILAYHANASFAGQVLVLPVTFERQDYAIGLRPDSPFREDVNRVLLRQIGQAWWADMQYQYMGRR